MAGLPEVVDELRHDEEHTVLGENENLLVVVHDHDVIAAWRRAFMGRLAEEKLAAGVWVLRLYPGGALELVG